MPDTNEVMLTAQVMSVVGLYSALVASGWHGYDHAHDLICCNSLKVQAL